MNWYIVAVQAMGLMWIFGWAIFILVVWDLRYKRRMHRLELIHRERLAAMEKGLPLPELPDVEAEIRARWDARWERLRAQNLRIWSRFLGLILLSGGAGTLAALKMNTQPAYRDQWPFAIIPMAVGFGFLLQYLLSREKSGA